MPSQVKTLKALKSKSPKARHLPKGESDDESGLRRETKPEPSKTKKRKRNADNDDAQDVQVAKQTEKRQKTTRTAETKPQLEAKDDDEDGTENNKAAEAQDTPQAPADGKRFIVFIGNLPFTATRADIQARFISLKPISIRLLTDKTTGKSRGIAFVEFGNYSHMKTCLSKFHHSEFNDGKSAARKINVELTGGGGGNSARRTTKIKGKNQKLREERHRRMEAELKAKHKKDTENAAKAASQAAAGTGGQQDHVHPSRRGRVPERKKPGR